MYRIGIVDDNKSDCDDIQVSILDNAGIEAIDSGIQFKVYELESRTKKEILDELRMDVEEGNIHALIVDYKLDTKEEVIEGWEIIEFMHEETPEFPVVILTNAPEESRESRYTDADKVYMKKVFLDSGHAETKRMVDNILLNMQKYVARRTELEAKLETELKNLEKNQTDDKALQEIIRIETELSKYKQMYQTTLDTMLDMNELKDVFEQLRQYEELLG